MIILVNKLHRNMSVNTMDVDEALKVVGGYRRWHLAIFAALGLSTFVPLASMNMMFVFIGWTPPHHCALPDGSLVNETIPSATSYYDQSISKCEMYVNHTLSNDTMFCPGGWNYITEGEHTIVTEWDLVCGNNYLAELSETISMIGSLCAELTMSIICDKIGRKKVHIGGLIVVLIMGSIMAASPNYTFFVIMRPIVSIGVVATLIPGTTMILELFDSSKRAFAGMIGMGSTWVFAYMLLALLGYFIRQWRHLVAVLALSNIIWMIHIWILPESVWWLTANGKDEEAEKVLQNMARWNGVKVDGRLLKESTGPIAGRKEYIGKKLSNENELGSVPLYASGEDKPASKSNEQVWDMLRDPLLRKFTIISTLMWFANQLVYYGLVLCTPTLAGDRYLNFALSGLVEIPAYVIVFLILPYGRKRAAVFFHCLAGILLIIATFISLKTDASLAWLATTAALGAKFAITASFAVVVLYSKEIFPTNLRGTSAGLCNILGRVGSMGAPFMLFAAKEIPWVPNVILGTVASLVGLLCLLLPETCHLPLPQNIDDIHKMFGKQQTDLHGDVDTKESSQLDDKNITKL